MTTKYTSLGLTEPLKFMGATVLSFNTSLGLGSSPSTLTVTLIEDCDPYPPPPAAQIYPPDAFVCNLPDSNQDKLVVGDPVFFTAGSFTFGGIISSWDVKLDASGRIFTVRINDPRELLQNTAVVFSEYTNGPYVAANYVNIFKYLLEYQDIPFCDKFPLPNNTEEGTPYNNIINALAEIQDSNDPILGPFVYSPTYGTLLTPFQRAKFRIDFTTFPGGINSIFYPGFPQFYRLDGPNAPLSEILESATEVAGFEYYVYLEQGDPENNIPHTIKIGLIDLSNVPTDFTQIQTFADSMIGKASDISYGQELRNDKTRNILIGDKIKYMDNAKSFLPYFGQEYQNGEMVLVVPYGWDKFGFWINKNTDTLIPTLDPTIGLLLSGVYKISELDIRMAMSSFKSWFFWVFITQAVGTFNQAIRNLFPTNRLPNTTQIIQAIAGDINAIQQLGIWIDQNGKHNASKLAADFANHHGRAGKQINQPLAIHELEKIHSWLSTLGNEYYGKKYLCDLQNYVCHYLTEFPTNDPDNDGDPIFSSQPTDAAWSEPGTSVIGLNDPFLEIFRDQSGKLKAFAAFTIDGVL